jgi:hypothetical protein
MYHMCINLILTHIREAFDLFLKPGVTVNDLRSIREGVQSQL